MAIRFKYTPPAVNAVEIMLVATPAAAHAGAQLILDAAQPNVPVDQGVMKASGRVVQEGTHAAITYGRDDDGTATHAPSNQYVVKQHEDAELAHPNGGTFKWLETAMHSEGAHAAEAMAALLRDALT